MKASVSSASGWSGAGRETPIDDAASVSVVLVALFRIVANLSGAM